MAKNLTQGRIFTQLIAFSLPYFLACFLQTFYGVADLFIAGQFNGPSTITAIHIGSQIMHMITLMIAGMAMGTTVLAGRAFGAGDQEQLSAAIGTSITLFAGIAVILMSCGLICVDQMAAILQTPPEALRETIQYSSLCFLGIPFISAYNVIAATCRGLGDSRHPLLFVAVGGIFNIILDYILIGPCALGAAGAAWATVIAQGITVIFALFIMHRHNPGIRITRKTLRIQRNTLSNIVSVGLPTASQDAFIQITFLFITAIANARGLEIAASVGIVEKLICFFFLVPSAMLASVSAMAAQNRGAQKHDRSRAVLRYGILTCTAYGAIIGIACQFISPWLIGFFTTDPSVIRYGAQYLRTYSFDVLFAGIHFCFSGYFCAYSKAGWAFIHNVFSSITTRIPGTWIASVCFPLTLMPMGMAAPLGSIVSALICVLIYRHYRNNFISC